MPFKGSGKAVALSLGMTIIPVVSVEIFLRNKGESLILIAFTQKLAAVLFFDRMRGAPLIRSFQK